MVYFTTTFWEICHNLIYGFLYEKINFYYNFFVSLITTSHVKPSDLWNDRGVLTSGFGSSHRLHFHEKGYDKLAMMFLTNLASNFWVDAFIVALYFIKKIPSTTLNFDTLATLKFIFLKRYSKHKLITKKTYPFVFLAYSSLQKRYKCLHASPNK